MALYLRDDVSFLDRALRRSHDQRVLAGVCGGVAEWLGVEVAIVRLAYLGIALVTSVLPMAILYWLLAFVIPEARSRRAHRSGWES